MFQSKKYRNRCVLNRCKSWCKRGNSTGKQAYLGEKKRVDGKGR